jgi:hypothetical protein
MKSAIVTLLLVAALGSTCALAQEGSGSGPPRQAQVIIINPVPLPTTVAKLVQPKFR